MHNNKLVPTSKVEKFIRRVWSEMKNEDNSGSRDDVSVWTMDLQCVLTCPNTKASAMYYKTKLVAHNMTYYNLKTKEGLCYIFDETNGDLSSKNVCLAALPTLCLSSESSTNYEIDTVLLSCFNILHFCST